MTEHHQLKHEYFEALGSTVFYWLYYVLLCSTMFYYVLLCSTVFYCVLLFYYVLLLKALSSRYHICTAWRAQQRGSRGEEQGEVPLAFLEAEA